MRRAGARRWLAMLLCLGCDGLGAAAPATCHAAGDQCALEGGPLGVCERTTCAEAGPEPCFVCTPQH